MSHTSTRTLTHTDMQFLSKIDGEPLLSPDHLTRVFGDVVSTRDIEFEEDLTRDLAPGIVWRRRRLRFHVGEGRALERLCINIVEVDPTIARVEPALAMEHAQLAQQQELEDTYWATAWAEGAVRASWGLREPRLFVDTLPIQLGTHPDAPAAAERLHQESTNESSQQHFRMIGHSLEGLRAKFVEGHNPTGNPSLVRMLPAIPASRLGQSRGNIFAVSAAGFYLNFPEEYGDGYSSLHQPVGCVQIEDRLSSPPWVERPCFIGNADRSATIQLVGPENLRLTLDGDFTEIALHRGIQRRGTHGAVWRAWDPPHDAPPEGTGAILFSGGIIVAWGPAEKIGKPPVGGAVVWLTGPAGEYISNSVTRPSATLRVVIPDVAHIHCVVAGGPILVRDGKATRGDAILSTGHAGEFHRAGPPPSRFPYDADRTRAPRTAIGITPNGHMQIVVVDGRRAGEHSAGLTLDGLAELCHLLGHQDAMTLDGGGSAVLAVEGVSRLDGLTETVPLGVVNIPSDGHGKERLLPVLLTVVSE